MNRLIRRAYGSIIKIGTYNCLEVLRFIPSDISRPIIINKDKEYSKLLDTIDRLNPLPSSWDQIRDHVFINVDRWRTSEALYCIGPVTYSRISVILIISNLFFPKTFHKHQPMSSTWEYFIYDVMPFVQLCKTHHGSTIY